MHKKTIFISFIAFVLSLLFCVSLSYSVEAKTVSSHDFSITVGDEEYAYAILQNTNHNNETKQQIHFRIYLNKEVVVSDAEEYKYVWTHKFELYQGGQLILDEIDVMPSKTGDVYADDATFYTRKSQETVLFSKLDYLFLGYDIDPTLEYTVKFYNSFSCVDCPSDYEYKEQVLEPIELKLATDTIAPTLDQSGYNSIVKVENGVRRIINGSKFSVTFSDSGSGINRAYYLFTDVAYNYVDDVLNHDEVIEMTSGQELSVDLKSSSYGEGYLQVYDWLWGNYNKTYYVFFVVFDNCENVYAYRNDFALYIEKDKNDIVYTGEISEEGSYRNISIDIDTTYETYYSLSENSFEDLKVITSKYTQPISLGSSENGVYYLHIVQYDNMGNLLKFSRKYTFDNTAPSVNTTISSIPVENTSYKSVNIGVQFKDVYRAESSEVEGVGVGVAYYYLSDKLLTKEDYALINNSYIIGQKLAIENLDDGTYYMYFRVLDILGNEAVYYYTYILDNTAPVVDILSYTESLVPVVDPYVSFTVSGSNTAVYRCGWFEDGVTPTYSQLTKICNPSSNITVDIVVEGGYRLWIYASDKAGNDVYEKSPVVLVDKKGPTVSVTNQYDTLEYLYSNIITIDVEDGASAIEDVIYYAWSKSNTTLTSDNITNTTTDGVVNYPLGVYGTYNLYIKVKDVLGNESVTKVETLYYIDTDEIKLNLYGDKKITIIKNTKYEEEGATAYKSSNKSIKVNVVIEGSVDTSKAGKYVIKYIAGEGELQVIETRVIIVKEVNQYYIITGVAFATGIIVSLMIRLIRNRKKVSSES